MDLWSRKYHYIRNEDQMFSISSEHREGRNYRIRQNFIVKHWNGVSMESVEFSIKIRLWSNMSICVQPCLKQKVLRKWCLGRLSMSILCIRAFQIYKEPPLIATPEPHSCKDLIKQYKVKFSSFLPSILLAFLYVFVNTLITVITEQFLNYTFSLTDLFYFGARQKNLFTKINISSNLSS